MTDVFGVYGVGRITRDSDMKYTTGEMAIAKFSIAVNRRVKKGDEWNDEASFFDCVLFGKKAENLNQYLVKGKQIAITGTPIQERWEKDGKTNSKVVFNIDSIQLIGGNKEGATVGRETAPASGDGFMDDINF